MSTFTLFNPLYIGNLQASIFTNSEDPDEMQHNSAFQQGLHLLLRSNQSSLNCIKHFLNSTEDTPEIKWWLENICKKQRFSL